LNYARNASQHSEAARGCKSRAIIAIQSPFILTESAIVIRGPDPRIVFSKDRLPGQARQ
jgi:hypothetical protein